MLFKRDAIRYKQKPNSSDIANIQMRLKNMNQIQLTIDELKNTIERGSSFYLAQFKENGSVSIDNTLGTEYIGIDCDNKEQIITLEEVIDLIKSEFNATPILSYFTFSSTKELQKYRLIYQLDRFIDAANFKKLYNSLILTLNKKYEIIDVQASNCNRLWSGTNKAATVYDDSIPFNTSEIISRLPKISEKKKAPKKDIDTSCYNFKGMYINKQYTKYITQKLKDEIDIKDYLETHFNVQFKNNRCACPVHNGNNKSAFTVYNNTCHCFTRCGSLDIIDLAKEYYHINDFNEIVFRLLDEYRIPIDEKAILIKRRK